MEPSTAPDGGAPDSDEFDWLTLDADETVVWADTPHEMSLVPAFIVGIPLSLLLVGIPILVGAYLSHRNTNYLVTTTALYRKTGVLSRNVQRIEFDKVQDTSYRQSFFGSYFGYGTVDVSTAGGTGVELSFTNVADPQALQRRINERIRTDRDTGEDRDKAAVLDDILDELRAIRTAVEGGDGGSASARADDPAADRDT
ncbi:PH domain-containing protein [Haloglomus litoreum]|uniref:PH domain-containing protein n=1 Tax=Haloglomus litoreum TaxID=3034026 RepID=UPI0023E86B37|nr:PH domain-containing protein [Haloglomus sp. DT116]